MNEIPLSILFSILATVLVISAFFSGFETVLKTLNRFPPHPLIKKRHKAAIKTNELLNHPDHLAGLIRLGGNFLNILASSLTTLIAIRVGGGEAVAPAVALLTIIVLIFSAVIPKSLGGINPGMLAFLSDWVYAPLLKIFYPIIHANNFIFGRNPKKGKFEKINKEESGCSDPEADALMPSRYQNMLLRILDLESASVEDIMTHRNDIIGIDIEDSIENIIRQLQDSPHTRLPVYKKNIDRVIGFLHLRKILALIQKPGFDKQKITDNLIKPFFIPAGTSIQRQMQMFKAEKLRIGLVVDEYGDVLGLVSLDDLLQEIIGEFIAGEPHVKKQKDGGFLVDAGVTIRELNRITQWTLPTEGPKTLNGLIIEYMETIPESGTSIKLHGHHLEIIKCDENTVKLVKFNPQV